ncbi:MAG: hypothetical protein IKP38_10955 [Clostridia bacterium]|nr:hypothetical protein [Clostridia bacterium]
MRSLVCPVCGGKLHIVIETGLATCESCGKTFDADPKDVQKYGGIVRDAERLMRQNTVAGYEDAIKLLSSIPFVSGVKEKQEDCEKRLSELQKRTERHRALLHREDEKNTKLGIILLILTILFATAAIAGIVYLIILWSKGMLSRPAVIVIASVAVIAVALALFGRLRSGN